MERKLATIRKISSLTPIEGADKIELAQVDGWKVVVKKGEFEVDHLALYLEIDSWVPTELAPFLTSPGKEPREFRGVKGERLRTVRLRGQISQGLLLPLDEYTSLCASEGNDLTENLNILKWEPEVPAQLAGQAKGNFPSFIPKTDQERIQNVPQSQLEQWSSEGALFQVTEKLDGSSMTVFFHEGRMGVCSRNLELKEDPENAFWKQALKEHGLTEFKLYCSSYEPIAIQGELIGPGIQGNPYKLSETLFFVYDIWNIQNQGYLSPNNVAQFCLDFKLNHVPILQQNFPLNPSKDSLLSSAEGLSAIGPAQREGLVYKHMNGQESFKVISNKWLLKNE